MKSTPLSITRLPSAGAYYVQTTDPTLTKQVREGDMWFNTATGGISVYRSRKWVPIKLSGVSLMDACITNNLIANDINASKIATGRLVSRNGEFMLDLDTGEAVLDSMKLGGKVEGNVIAESNDGLMRIRLVGKDPTNNVSAQVAGESRTSTSAAWEQKGLMWLEYWSHQSLIAMEGFYVGTGFNASRPLFALDLNEQDGVICRPYSQDMLRAAYVTHHGMRLVQRESAYDQTLGEQYPFNNVPAVNTAVGNFLIGTTVECTGSCTMTYCMNDVAKIDFDFTITTAGTGSSEFGLSKSLLRQLNNDIPYLTPIDGGNLSIFNSNGILVNSGYGAMMVSSEENDDLWVPATLIVSTEPGVEPGETITITKFEHLDESDLTAGLRFVGVCYAMYTFNTTEDTVEEEEVEVEEE